MIARRLTSTLALGLVTIALSVNAICHTVRQQPTDETARGISLQQHGKTEEAVAALRAVVKHNKNDLLAWHYLGLALQQKGDANEARKAHERAATLGDKLLTDQLDEASNGGEVSKRLTPLGEKLAVAVDSAQKYLQLAPQSSGKKLQEWQIRADYLRVFAEIANAPAGTRLLLSSKEVSVKARVLSKPEPQYSEEARSKQETGTVILRAWRRTARSSASGFFPVFHIGLLRKPFGQRAGLNLSLPSKTASPSQPSFSSNTISICSVGTSYLG